jgi:RNase P subunit RPR2
MEDRGQRSEIRDQEPAISHPDSAQEKQFTRTRAKIADVCDECSDPIWPGDAMVIYVERSFTGYTGREMFISRHYCDRCGKLLDDSLTTTETC